MCECWSAASRRATTISPIIDPSRRQLGVSVMVEAARRGLQSWGGERGAGHREQFKFMSSSRERALRGRPGLGRESVEVVSAFASAASSSLLFSFDFNLDRRRPATTPARAPNKLRPDDEQQVPSIVRLAPGELAAKRAERMESFRARPRRLPWGAVGGRCRDYTASQLETAPFERERVNSFNWFATGTCHTATARKSGRHSGEKTRRIQTRPYSSQLHLYFTARWLTN